MHKDAISSQIGASQRSRNTYLNWGKTGELSAQLCNEGFSSRWEIEDAQQPSYLRFNELAVCIPSQVLNIWTFDLSCDCAYHLLNISHAVFLMNVMSYIYISDS